MKKEAIISAKTVEEAVALAVKELGDGLQSLVGCTVNCGNAGLGGVQSCAGAVVILVVDGAGSAIKGLVVEQLVDVFGFLGTAAAAGG